MTGSTRFATFTNSGRTDSPVAANLFRFASHTDGGTLGVQGACASGVAVVRAGSARRGCEANGAAYAGAIGTFGFRMWALSTTLAAAPPASAIGQSLGIAIIAAGMVYGTAIALHDCLHEAGAGSHDHRIIDDSSR